MFPLGKELDNRSLIVKVTGLQWMGQGEDVMELNSILNLRVGGSVKMKKLTCLPRSTP